MCYSELMKNITIKEIREQTGLSQSQFAKKFHLTTRVVQSWEQGQRNTPDCIIYMIQRILELESEKQISERRLYYEINIKLCC